MTTAEAIPLTSNAPLAYVSARSAAAAIALGCIGLLMLGLQPLLLGALQRLPAVTDRLALVAFEPEVQAYEFADIGFVLDDQHAWRHVFFTIGSCRRHPAPVRVRQEAPR